MNYGLHLGNTLFLFAYSVRDILWLRVLTVVATLCLMQYYFCCSAGPLYGPIVWNTLFISVNLFQIGMLVLERRPVFLGEDELRLYNSVFRSLTPREYMSFVSKGEYKTATEGQELLRQDAPVEELMLVSKGRGNIQVDGRHVAEVSPGQFVGEMGFLTQKNASASVTASLSVEYLAWPAEKLRALFAEAPQLHVKIQGVLGHDLVEKLRQEGFATAHPSQVMGTYSKSEKDSPTS